MDHGLVLLFGLTAFVMGYLCGRADANAYWIPRFRWLSEAYGGLVDEVNGYREWWTRE